MRNVVCLNVQKDKDVRRELALTAITVARSEIYCMPILAVVLVC